MFLFFFFFFLLILLKLTKFHYEKCLLSTLFRKMCLFHAEASDDVMTYEYLES